MVAVRQVNSRRWSTRKQRLKPPQRDEQPSFPGRGLLYPDIVLGRAVTTGIARVHHTARLDQQHLHFAVGVGLVLDAFGQIAGLKRAG